MKRLQSIPIYFAGGICVGFLVLLMLVGAFGQAERLYSQENTPTFTVQSHSPEKQAPADITIEPHPEHDQLRKIMIHNQKRVPVMTYHHVIPGATDNYSITPETFEAQMRAVKAMGYTTITPDQLLAAIQHKAELPPNPLLITFDDGAKDNYDYAYPILKKYDLKATFFLIGNRIDNNPLFLTSDMVREMYDSGLISMENHSWELHDLIVRADGSKVTPLMERLKGENEETHLARITEDLKKCSDKIESITGKRPIAISYPNGLQDAATVQAVKNTGMQLAFLGGNMSGIKIDNCDPFLLKRYNIASDYNTKQALGIINRERVE